MDKLSQFASMLRFRAEESRDSAKQLKQEHDKVNGVVNKITNKYEKQKSQAEKAYLEQISSIETTKKAEIDQVDRTQLDEYKQAFSFDTSMLKSIAEKITTTLGTISNEQVCEMLFNQTGLAWKVLPITSSPRYSTQAEDYLNRYGLAFVNENDPNFQNEAIQSRQDFQKNTQSIKVIADGYSSAPEHSQAELQKWNWAEYYTYATIANIQDGTGVDVFPHIIKNGDYGNLNKYQDFNRTDKEFSDTILTAIEKTYGMTDTQVSTQDVDFGPEQ